MCKACLVIISFGVSTAERLSLYKCANVYRKSLPVYKITITIRISVLSKNFQFENQTDHLIFKGIDDVHGQAALPEPVVPPAAGRGKTSVADQRKGSTSS